MDGPSPRTGSAAPARRRGVALFAMAAGVLIGLCSQGCLKSEAARGSRDGAIVLSVERCPKQIKLGERLDVRVQIENQSGSTVHVPSSLIAGHVWFEFVTPNGDTSRCQCLMEYEHEGGMKGLLELKPGSYYAEALSSSITHGERGRWALLVGFQSPKAKDIPSMVKGSLRAKKVEFWVR